MKRQPSRPQVIIEALKVFQSLSVGWDVSFFLGIVFYVTPGIFCAFPVLGRSCRRGWCFREREKSWMVFVR